MKLLIVGDVHAHIRLFSELVNKTECDAVLQCGDIGIWSLQDFCSWGYVEDKHGHYNVYGTMAPITDVTNSNVRFEKPVYFISGNHENFELLDVMNKNKEFDGRWNFEYVPHTKPAKIENGKEVIKVSGLSGCYSYKVFTGGIQKQGRRHFKVKPETPPEIEDYLNRILGRDPRGRFKANEVEVIKKQKSDIVLFHEIPTGVNVESMLKIENETGCSALNDIIDKMQPKYAFCGHWHRKAEVMIGKTKVVVLPMLYRDRNNLVSYAILDTENWELEWFAHFDER